MTTHDPGPARAGTRPPPRRPSLAGRLRVALPATRRDLAATLAAYAAFTGALHAFLHFAWPAALLASAVSAAAVITVTVIASAAGRRPGPGGDGR
jgi:hypothetical protein